MWKKVCISKGCLHAPFLCFRLSCSFRHCLAFIISAFSACTYTARTGEHSLKCFSVHDTARQLHSGTPLLPYTSQHFILFGLFPITPRHLHTFLFLFTNFAITLPFLVYLFSSLHTAMYDIYSLDLQITVKKVDFIF